MFKLKEFMLQTLYKKPRHINLCMERTHPNER